MNTFKYILKRILIGVGIALALMFIKGNLLMQVQAKSLLTNKVASEVYVYNNTAYSFTTTMDNPFFKNAGIGYLYFTFSSYKASGTSTAPISLIRSAVVFSGDTGYVCEIGSSSLTNSTYGGVVYSARCPVNIGGSGITKIVYAPSDLQANDISLYRFTNEGYYTFESDSSVNVNVDTSSTTNAINNQTSTITNNANNNTNQIINNQNKNTQDIIDNENKLLGNLCDNIFGDYVIRNGYLFDTRMSIRDVASDRLAFIPIEPNTTYTIKRSVITTSFRVSDYTSIPNMTSEYVNYTVPRVIENNNGNTITYTTSSTAKYLVIHYGNSINDTSSLLSETLATMQVNKGTTVKAYCKYGTATSSKLDDTNSNLSNINNTLNNSDTDQAQQDSDSAFLDFDLNTHGLTRIITAPIRLLTAMLGGTCNSLTLPLPFVNQNVVLPCMSSIYQQHFGNFLILYRLITDGIIGYWVAVNVFRKCKDFLDPTNDKIEVFNL